MRHTEWNFHVKNWLWLNHESQALEFLFVHRFWVCQLPKLASYAHLCLVPAIYTLKLSDPHPSISCTTKLHLTTCFSLPIGFAPSTVWSWPLLNTCTHTPKPQFACLPAPECRQMRRFATWQMRHLTCFEPLAFIWKSRPHLVDELQWGAHQPDEAVSVTAAVIMAASMGIVNICKSIAFHEWQKKLIQPTFCPCCQQNVNLHK